MCEVIRAVHRPGTRNRVARTHVEIGDLARRDVSRPIDEVDSKPIPAANRCRQIPYLEDGTSTVLRERQRFGHERHVAVTRGKYPETELVILGRPRDGNVDAQRLSDRVDAFCIGMKNHPGDDVAPISGAPISGAPISGPGLRANRFGVVEQHGLSQERLALPPFRRPQLAVERRVVAPRPILEHDPQPVVPRYEREHAPVRKGAAPHLLEL